MDHPSQAPAELVVLDIIFPILDMVPTHDLDLSEGSILFPLHSRVGLRPRWSSGLRRSVRVNREAIGRARTYVEKVDLLQQTLFVMLQLSHLGFPELVLIHPRNSDDPGRRDYYCCLLSIHNGRHHRDRHPREVEKLDFPHHVILTRLGCRNGVSDLDPGFGGKFYRRRHETRLVPPNRGV